MSFFKNQTAPAAAPDLQLDYLITERISVQWQGFLAVLSEELQEQLEPAEYRELLHRMGGRFANNHPIAGGDTVNSLENSLNALWKPLRWGYAELSDVGNHLEIRHHLCPLPDAMHTDNQIAGGFLEGVYEAWLHAAGAGRDLQVRQLPDSADPFLMVFQFGRN